MQIRLSEDKVKLYLTVEDTDTREAIMGELTKRGIKALIQNDALEKAVDSKTEQCIAQGIPPEKGTDGELRFMVDISKSMKPKVDINVGKVDYHDLGIYEFVKKGQRLVEIVASTPGKDGIDVFGQPVRAENGAPVVLTIGKNVVREGSFVLSTVDGVVDMLAGTLVVKEILEIYHDIDYSIGNIDFNGNVVIRGNVFPNFKVISGGDIFIDGIVDKAEIQALGSVVITGGIIGHEKTVVKAHSITARFVNQAKLYAEDTISIQGEILHSYCESKNKIKASSIIGGVTRAKNEIYTEVAGSQSAVKTEFVVGRDDYIAVEMQKIETEEHALNETKRKVALQISDLKMREVRKQLDENGKRQLQQMLDMMAKINATLDDRIARKNELTKQAEDTGRGIVYINDIVFNNVHVAIGSATLSNTLLVKHVKYLKVSKLVKMFDMDDAVGDKAKILGAFYIGQKEFQVDIKKIDFNGEKITVGSSVTLETSIQGKLIFSHPVFNDYYEMEAIVAGHEGSEYTMNMLSLPQRRISKKKNSYYEDIPSVMTQLMIEPPVVQKVIVDELHDNTLYMKSEVILSRDALYEVVLDAPGGKIKIVVKPFGNSMKTRSTFETKCYFERIDSDDMVKLKKLLTERG